MKRWLLTFMVLVLVLSSGFIAFAQTNDYENSWAKDEIEYMKEKEIISGYPDGSFRPNNNMSKAEFYTVINGLMGYSERAENVFYDVTPSDWFYQEVEKGLKAKYMLPDFILNANDNITRGEVARIISVVFDIEEDEEMAEVFKDHMFFTKENKGVIGGLVKNGFISGFPDGTFRHEAEITRAEVVKMLYNIAGKIVNKAGTVSGEVYSNIVVNTDDVFLKDMAIDGNLYLTEGIGEGNVTLENVVVNGELKINGGGANSIIIINSKINSIFIDKQNGLIRVIFEGTEANEVRTANEAILELTNGTEINTMALDGSVEVEIEKGVSITVLDAVGKEITIESKGDIESIISNEDIEINGKKAKADEEYRVENGKLIQIKPEPLKPKQDRDDDYYDYIPPTYSVRASAGAGGTIRGDGRYERGEQVTLTAIANEGYKFLYWMDEEGVIIYDNPYTFEMPRKSIEFTAYFKDVSQEIAALAAVNTASNADAMMTAIETNAAKLGLAIGEGTGYASLIPGRDRSVSVDLYNNRQYETENKYTLIRLREIFDDIVATRLVTQESMDLVNNAETAEKLNGIEYVTILLNRFKEAGYTQHSSHQIANKITYLEGLVARYNALSTDAKEVVLRRVIELRNASKDVGGYDGKFARSEHTTDALETALNEVEAVLSAKVAFYEAAEPEYNLYADETEENLVANVGFYADNNELTVTFLNTKDNMEIASTAEKFFTEVLQDELGVKNVTLPGSDTFDEKEYTLDGNEIFNMALHALDLIGGTPDNFDGSFDFTAKIQLEGYVEYEDNFKVTFCDGTAEESTGPGGGGGGGGGGGARN